MPVFMGTLRWNEGTTITAFTTAEDKETAIGYIAYKMGVATCWGKRELLSYLRDHADKFTLSEVSTDEEKRIRTVRKLSPTGVHMENARRLGCKCCAYGEPMGDGVRCSHGSNLYIDSEHRLRRPKCFTPCNFFTEREMSE